MIVTTGNEGHWKLHHRLPWHHPWDRRAVARELVRESWAA